MYSEFKLHTKDKTDLFCRAWETENKPLAIVVMVHGKGEHSGRYVELCEYLNSQNFSVYIFDLRGHGHTVSKVGHTAPRNKVLEDINLLVTFAKTRFPDTPVFIYGHSLGGNIVLTHRTLSSEGIKAYIVSSPWLKLYNPYPKAEEFFVSTISHLFPRISVKTGIDPESISSVKEERGENDPLANNIISLATFRDVVYYSNLIFKTAPQVKIPFLLVHGTDDTLISIEGSRKLKQLSGEICTYFEFEKSRHEVHHDYEKKKLFSIISEYIKNSL